MYNSAYTQVCLRVFIYVFEIVIINFTYIHVISECIHIFKLYLRIEYITLNITFLRNILHSKNLHFKEFKAGNQMQSSINNVLKIIKFRLSVYPSALVQCIPGIGQAHSRQNLILNTISENLQHKISYLLR